MPPEQLLLITPVRNEAAHLERVARAVAAQTHPPSRWVVVEDASTDGTPELLERLEREIDFLTVVQAPAEPAAEGVDRLARAAAPRNFNLGLRHAGWDGFTHVGKLDGDVELPHDYFERIFARMRADPALGIACGDLLEEIDGVDRRIRIPEHHVHGALKLYTRDCFDAIGGVQERLGWDTIDETYARMRGFSTRSYEDILARHHRPWGSADGTLRGRARHGRCAYVAGYPMGWILLRSMKLATVRPYGSSGVAFLLGYLRARAKRMDRVDDPEFRRFVRRELRGRVLAPLRAARI